MMATGRIEKMCIRDRLPSVLASGVTQFTIFINTGFALDLQKGSVTALTTAFRLWQLPVGL